MYLLLGVFLVPYLVLAVTCGLPLFLLETAMGQYTQEGGITCWRKICPLAEGKSGCPVFIRYLMDLDSRSACDKFLLCSNQLASILNIILVVRQCDMWNDDNVGHSRSLNHLSPRREFSEYLNVDKLSKHLTL